MSYDREPVEATVAELKPRMKNLTISFKVLEVGETRDVESRRDNTTHRVADARVGDSSGTVEVPLWDETIDTVEEGKSYTLTNGYTGLFRGNLRLNIGKYGQLSDAEEAIEEIDEDNDMSAAEHEDDRRGYRRGGGGYGGRSGGYGGRSYGGGNRDRRGGGYGGRDRGRRY
jgi:replication factor A1